MRRIGRCAELGYMAVIKYGDEINWNFAHFQVSKSERLLYFDECVYRIRVFILCTPDIDRNLVTM